MIDNKTSLLSSVLGSLPYMEGFAQQKARRSWLANHTNITITNGTWKGTLNTTLILLKPIVYVIDQCIKLHTHTHTLICDVFATMKMKRTTHCIRSDMARYSSSTHKFGYVITWWQPKKITLVAT